MLRKLRPLEKKLSTAFSLKSKKSQHSITSAKSGHSRQGDNQQPGAVIPDGASTREPPLGTRDDSSYHGHESGKRFQQNAPCEHPNEVSKDSLASRYRRAVNDSVPETLNVTGAAEEQEPLNAVDTGSSSSGDESHFDWNQTDESELDESERQERDERKRREVQGQEEHEHTIRHAKRLRRFYLFLMKLSAPVRTTIIGFLGASTAMTPAILVWLRFTDLSARNHVLAWSIWLSISFAASCATSIIVDVLPSIAMKLFDLLYGSKPESLKTQAELWINVRFYTKLALGLASYWVTLSVMFSHVFHLREDSHLHYFGWVKKATAGLFTAGVVLLCEKVLLQVIQLNFHRTSLKARLEENEQALWALDQLAAAKGISHSPKKRNSKFLSNWSYDRMKSGRWSSPTKGSTIVDVPSTPIGSRTVFSGEKRTPEKRNPGGMTCLEPGNELGLIRPQQKRRRSSNLLMFADHVTTALNSALKNGNGPTGGTVSTHSAKKLAKKLFEGLDEDRGGVITRNEFEPFFKTASDATRAFKLFDKDGNGDIDRKEMRNAVVRIYKERRALAIGLKDMSSAVSKLDVVLISLACLLTIFIWFFIFNPQGTSAQLVPMATIILGFSFIFGNAAKNLFESMLFIFSIHPYDVGDLVFIDNTHMYVMEFGLFSTTFQRVDGQVVVAPNSLLIGKKHIINIRRSGPMWETTEVMVGFDTPLEVLHEFRAKLRQYVIDNPREWKGGLDVNIDFINNQNLIQLIVAMEHKTNWQDWGARWNRRTFIMKEMKRIMNSLNISYKLPPQPISLLPQRPGLRQVSSKLENSSIQSHYPRAGARSLSSSLATTNRSGNPSRPMQSDHSLPSLQLPRAL
ncbi:hypothetical protein PtA15_7A105 [Puccinia triticina]|uniref:EF-hand domain-containing protein n=1 Tax=Puccinia triticina TaxID=208348 RepID=A0ABY7CNY9_9BASI|nr:uncharacterized protein PtA15_7A105 [Puccinia triticina]WAQ86379.1 hypothetical protein PtA15_7A105 [Puccinia triticina]WAR56260.1 hypothetical protein PtB15_7B106 [Puccinia triticina]